MTFVASQHYLTQTEAPAPRTLVEKAYRAMRADIIEGRLPPGYKLRVEHLKEDYDVGAGTLREALSLLVSDALVYAEGQRGYRVSPIPLDDLEDLTNQRVLLETEALRQSILKKAFSGQLVPQNPTDEPASALLARIKAEQSAAPKAKKARK